MYCSLFSLHQSWPDTERAIRVAHACGHQEIYEYGGTADYFVPRREAFRAEMAAQSCPTCCDAAKLAACDPIVLPILDAEIGGGVLRSDVPGYEGTPIVVMDEPLLLEESHGQSRYCRVLRLAARCSYMHRRPQTTYTPDQEAWVDEYAVRGHADRTPGNYERYQKFGASFGHDPRHFEEVERLTGAPVYLTSHGNWDADAAEEERVAGEEAALELACEEGLIPGAMPADL